MKGTEQFKQTIKAYLDERAKTPYHDQIIELVNKNMKLIMERMAS